jgi:hypothetical protein
MGLTLREASRPAASRPADCGVVLHRQSRRQQEVEGQINESHTFSVIEFENFIIFFFTINVKDIIRYYI